MIGNMLILATIFGGISLIIVAFFWGIRSLKGGGRGASKQQLEEETRIIQELYQGLTKMEERIEALETILLEKRKNEHKGNEAHDV